MEVEVDISPENPNIFGENCMIFHYVSAFGTQNQWFFNDWNCASLIETLDLSETKPHPDGELFYVGEPWKGEMSRLKGTQSCEGKGGQNLRQNDAEHIISLIDRLTFVLFLLNQICLFSEAFKTWGHLWVRIGSSCWTRLGFEDSARLSSLILGVLTSKSPSIASQKLLLNYFHLGSESQKSQGSQDLQIILFCVFLNLDLHF